MDATAEQSAPASATPQGMKDYPVPQREKYWEECTVEQKLDRVRDMLMNLNRDNAEFAQCVTELMRHTHDAQGGLLSPIKGPYNNDIQGFSRDRAYSIRTERERERGR